MMNQNENEIKELLDWTSKQGRILTANGKAETYYTPERGYPFQEDELPHYYLLSENHDTHDVFASWAKKSDEGTSSSDETVKETRNGKKKYPVCGAWTRPLFVGGFEYSTNNHEEVFNVQTNTLFIDMRIPTLGRAKIEQLVQEDKDVMNNDNNILVQFSNDQLKLYARRHAFAGYTILDKHQNRTVCTRHHCIDWNFVGKGRNRPNKWFVQMHPNHSNTWKEFAFAKDEFDQHYYFEQWERLDDDANGEGLVIALRKRKETFVNKNEIIQDGIILIVGNHFNYIFSRTLQGGGGTYDKGNLVDLVDAAVESGDRKTAEAYLSIDAGHGTIKSGWKIDCALQYWKEGTCLFSDGKDGLKLDRADVNFSSFTWNGSIWDVYESSLQSLDDTSFLFNWRGGATDDDINKLESILYDKSSRKRKLCKV